MAPEPTMTLRRDKLHALLLEIASNVYFQAPSNTVMRYPCIRYEINQAQNQHADNGLYFHYWQYQVMVIDRDPDSPIRDKVASLPMCRFERHYPADDLHHFVFNLYF